MSNNSERDGIPSNDRFPEEAVVPGEEALATGEQSVATPGTGVTNETLQHFHAALVNLVNEANKIGLTLPIGLGASSPYELTTSTHRNHPPGRMRSEVHIATPSLQAEPTMEEALQDPQGVLDKRRHKRGKGLLDEDFLEKRGRKRAHGEVVNDGSNRNHRRRRSI